MLFLPLDLAGMVVGLGRSVARVQRVGGGGAAAGEFTGGRVGGREVSKL